MTSELIVTDPKRNFGKPMFAKSGAPVGAVLERLRAGEPLDDIAHDFELTESELAYCREEFTPGMLRLSAAAERAFTDGRIVPAARARRRQAGVPATDSVPTVGLVASLRAWSPATCWHCSEWGCTNAAGHSTYCERDCSCDDHDDDVCPAPCAECGGDSVCTCACHINYATEAADAIEHLTEYVRDLCIENHHAPFEACARCAAVLHGVDD